MRIKGGASDKHIWCKPKAKARRIAENFRRRSVHWSWKRKFNYKNCFVTPLFVGPPSKYPISRWVLGRNEKLRSSRRLYLPRQPSSRHYCSTSSRFAFHYSHLFKTFLVSLREVQKTPSAKKSSSTTDPFLSFNSQNPEGENNDDDVYNLLLRKDRPDLAPKEPQKSLTQIILQ